MTIGCLAFAYCTDVEGPAAQVGAWLATSSLILADGQRVNWPVRRRFEMAAWQLAPGTQGYATVSHAEPHSVRVAGPEAEGLSSMSENRHPIMGHLFLLSLTQPVLPLSNDGPTEDELGGWEEVTLPGWCEACRVQGGLSATRFMPTPHAEVVADIILR